MVEIAPKLKAILDSLPPKPGVYLMKDAEGKVIYVGKAVNLRNRVRSYFRPHARHTPKTARMVSHVDDIEIIVTDSELEALILEMNLIKKYRPTYNVRLKDDKRYPYIKVYWADPFPRVDITRRIEQDGHRYFGPYTAAWSVRQTLDILRKVLPYLTCNRTITGNDERACLYYEIGLCSGPCIGAVSQAEYRAMIEKLMLFLEGRTDEVVKRLQEEMQKAADSLEFERAAAIRDRLRAIERVVERQKIISTAQVDQDVIAFARADGDTCVQVFFIRSGRLIGREYFLLEGAEGEDDKHVLTEFLKQFYDNAAFVPQEVLLPHQIDEAMVIEEWLRDRRGRKVTLTIPRRGQKKGLVEMVAENAAETLNMLRAQWAADTHKHEQALRELQEALELDTPPARIECYDISHTQGTAPVASRVVFVHGTPRKSEYRRFNVHPPSVADDYAAMREALSRRFRRYAEASGKPIEAAPGKKDSDRTWRLLPDLLVVDGGAGQVHTAYQVLREFGLAERVPVIGLAKRLEEIYRPGHREPLVLPRSSPALHLLQRIRDEAHRFALTSHRRRRRKVGMASVLEEIPGVGPVRRKALLEHFGSLDAIRRATVEEIASVPGIGPELAATIKDSL